MKEDNEKSNLISDLSPIYKSVKDEFLESSLDLSLDYGEIMFDSGLTDEVAKEVPFFKTLYAGGKIIGSIRNYYTYKNIIIFFKEFHSQKVDQEKMDKFISKFNDDINFQKKVINLIIQYNDRFIDSMKSKVLANLINSHINEEISWELLIDLIQILERMHPKLIKEMKLIFEDYSQNRNKINKQLEGLFFSCGIGYRFGSHFSLTDFGKDLHKFGINKLII